MLTIFKTNRDLLNIRLQSSMDRSATRFLYLIYSAFYQNKNMGRCLQHLIQPRCYECLFFWKSQTELNQDKISRQKIEKFIVTIPTLNQQFKDKITVIITVWNQRILNKFLKCIENIKELILIQTNVSAEFFKKLSRTNKRMLINLWLQDCRVGNELSNYIQPLPLHNLLKISIISDKFSNKGLKELMKAHMPSLNEIRLWDTNVTLDGLKLLKRKPENQFMTLSYYLRAAHVDNLIIKTVMNLSVQPDKFTFHSLNVGVPNVASLYQFGYFAKYPRKNLQKPTLIFNFEDPYQLEWIQKKSVEVLSKGYDIILHH